ncbi:MAG: serine/threonine-protein phosphatase [Bacteroidetes bacterium]|nr:serine/threonine-protein phosphatase [Bacteroidota bacterium]
MDQKKLHKLVESIASKHFSSERELLISVINQIIENEDIKVTGGRIWKLDTDKKSYKILYQTGNFEKLNPGFELKVKDYPMFSLIARERTILGDETNEVLLEKGIFKYSASGVGSKIKINDNRYFEYLLALNSDKIDNKLGLNLSIIATALTSQIKQRRYSASASHLKADIDKARQLQKSILPEHEYNFGDYEIYGVTDPAEIVSGDFFDYIEAGKEGERLGIVIGDAASKGVGAAAEAMYISGALRMAIGFEIKITPLMRRMNNLVNKIFEDDKFASLFYGELLSHKSGLFLYANAGHNPPIYYKAEPDETELLDTTGPLLGPVPNAQYYIESINFQKNDILLLFSDGIIETANTEFNQYGDEKLINKLKEVSSLSPKDIVLAILEDVVKYSKNGRYTDDKTLVVIKKIY